MIVENYSISFQTTPETTRNSSIRVWIAWRNAKRGNNLSALKISLKFENENKFLELSTKTVDAAHSSTISTMVSFR